MGASHTIWSLDDKKPLSDAELHDEKELELLLRDNITILNKSWMVIGNQVKTDAGKYIDILCLDHDGDLVVVELKKDMTPREVTAQAIDYAASMSKLSAEEIAQLYLQYSNGEKNLSEAYRDRFGSDLDENNLNQNVKMIIVAAQMDSGTERIIRYLRDVYQVDINILFFHVFKCGEQRLISRVWFEDDVEDIVPSDKKKKRSWNNEYYVSFGTEKDSRNWEDAVKYGFISAGGGVWYSHTLTMLSQGDRIWVNIPHTGYVGVGVVTDESQAASKTQFEVEGNLVNMKDLPLKGSYFNNEDDLEKQEYIVKVRWIKTVKESQAIKELGFFGNQNTVCRPLDDKWSFTVERLRKYWNIND